MEMRLDQARHDRAAPGIDAPCVRLGPADVGRVPGIDDPPVANHHGALPSGGAPVPSISCPLWTSVVPRRLHVPRFPQGTRCVPGH